MVKIEKLKKDFGQLEALKGVSLHVPKGELFAYLGPNGAGKTTTIRILTGLTRATSGDAYLNGHHIRDDMLNAKRQYGLVPQAVNLDQELTARQNLFIHGWLYHMKKTEIKERIRELMGYVELTDAVDKPVKTFSGGMKRRLMIARALLHEPAILFMDEPTVGLDAGIRRKVWALIRKIQENGTTIFLTTHYIEEAEFLAQRVAFIDQGKIITLDTPENLIQKQGAWAIDRMVHGTMKTLYFPSREEAKAYNTQKETSYTLRRVNLEDAFLAETGKKQGHDHAPPKGHGHGHGHGH